MSLNHSFRRKRDSVRLERNSGSAGLKIPVTTMPSFRNKLKTDAVNDPMEKNGNVCGDAVENGNKAAACLSAEAASALRGASSVEDLSEYTDADESVSSAPTEFLAEFLSAIMLKDYETALKYCKLILQYEPDNVTAKEFYPLIVEKIHLMEEEQDNSTSSSSSVSNSSGDDNGNGKPICSESDSDATTASYSSLEDEEADGNGNTTKLAMPVPIVVPTTTATTGPAFQSTSSDSESPTEPISQQLVAQLRAKVLPPRSK